MSKLNLAPAKNYLKEISSQSMNSVERGDAAVKLATNLLTQANLIQSSREKKEQAKLARMMEDPAGKIFTTCMTDECFRSEEPKRVASQITYLLDKHGVPKYLNLLDRIQMGCFQVLGEPLADQLIPLVKKLIRKETVRVIIPGEADLIEKHISKRKNEGITTNLNHLGEAILGEGEAKKRLDSYLVDLKKESVEYISVKISTIFSQLNSVAWEETQEILRERLRLLYRTCMENQYTEKDGTKHNKFVNLDMEEYRDLDITIELFKTVLDEEEFLNYRGGIVLQAYLPDTYASYLDLAEWSKKRMARGGAPIKVRLVKGANLAMEHVESELRHWESTPFSSKIESDANYKKILNIATQPENAKAVNLGIASHNLFDLAYALIVTHQNDVTQYCQFEMLEGMAEHLREVMHEISGEMVLYCPAAAEHEFQHAIAYLIRRLDENTADDNFLRHAFDLAPNTSKFDYLSDFFLKSCKLIDEIDNSPRRTQNRLEAPKALAEDAPFENEADTDIAIAKNRQWMDEIYDNARKVKSEQLPLIINGETIVTEKFAESIDPSTAEAAYKYSLAEDAEIETVLETADKAYKAFDQKDWQSRATKLKRVAQITREKRAELISVMIHDSGKTALEADVEVSEAVDFCEYYARSIEEWQSNEKLEMSGKGVVLITPPWNFPFAIPLGGVAAALAAGNSAIFKPAPEVPLSSFKAVEIFYEAGFSKQELQFIMCEDDPYGSKLIKDKRVKSVILTGATETAQLFMNMRPDLDLMAETGGKNVMIITDLCDRDLAAKDLVQSAFGHSGQKCSACSIAILEDKLYDDKHFLELVRDTAASMKVGDAYDKGTLINPLINPPAEKLKRALTTLEPGEEWLLKPQPTKNPHIWSPGIKTNVKPDGYTFNTEFFGPVLAIVRASDLDNAIKMASKLSYGLTGGIHTLDKREQEKWIESTEVGNAYVCRSITGAIVRRQPFGGYKSSAYGRGFKAGGPNYLIQLMDVKEVAQPTDQGGLDSMKGYLNNVVTKGLVNDAEVAEWRAAAASYAHHYENFFTVDHDPSNVQGQYNILRFKNIKQTTLIVQENDRKLDVYKAITACVVAGTTLRVVANEAVLKDFKLAKFANAANKVTVAAVADLTKELAVDNMSRIRVISDVPAEWLKVAADNFTHLQALPAYSSGRLELLNYIRPQALSIDYHRYGNLDNA